MAVEQIDRPAAPPQSAGAFGPDANVPGTHGVATAPARLLEFDRRKYVALPVHTALEIVERPEIIPVPGAPYYGLGIMRWQGRVLAAVNLCSLLNAFPKPGAPAPCHALVVAYQTAPRRPIEYGAIATISLPQAVQVDDGMQCALPVDSDLWPLISLSCFTHAGVAVPVIHTGRLFGACWE
jgi:hypothetical protein